MNRSKRCSSAGGVRTTRGGEDDDDVVENVDVEDDEDDDDDGVTIFGLGTSIFSRKCIFLPFDKILLRAFV